MSEWYVDTPAKPGSHRYFGPRRGSWRRVRFYGRIWLWQLAEHESINVVRFNFPYMTQIIRETGKKRPPDKMPKLEACYKEVIEQVTG